MLSRLLFGEVPVEFFRVLSSRGAAMYVDVLDALEQEAVQRNEGLLREEALEIVTATRQLDSRSLGDNLRVVFDEYSEQVGKTCYAELIRSQLHTALDIAHERLREMEGDTERVVFIPEREENQGRILLVVRPRRAGHSTSLRRLLAPGAARVQDVDRFTPLDVPSLRLR